MVLVKVQVVHVLVVLVQVLLPRHPLGLDGLGFGCLICCLIFVAQNTHTNTNAKTKHVRKKRREKNKPKKKTKVSANSCECVSDVTHVVMVKFVPVCVRVR